MDIDAANLTKSLEAVESYSGVAKLFAGAAARVTKTLAGPAKNGAIKVIASLEGYRSYLEETNERVSTVKTFANPAMPVNLLDHFVTTKLKQKDSEKSIDQDSLISKIIKDGRIVVSATAGFGKSMLMKYIALSLYQNPRGRIPIFIELRHLNRVKSPDITTYIHSTYKKTSSVNTEAFRQGLGLGAFVLILDGFDEVNHDLRPQVEAQILDLSTSYPKTSIIVSGRPDDKFLSWRQFEVWKICPMTKPQVVELINKLEYDIGTKKRFVAKIKKGLYETHQSFLSTPLLAILMLLTYEENADIPDKMHLFYAKAFETLFHKHDAMKEQYDRQRKSGLQIDDFEKVFSTFCLSSYVKEKLEFTKSEILSQIKNSITYTGLSIDGENMLFDLEEAVCVLQKEGLSYFFVHRSFQEYFTALFLSNCPEDVRDGFVDQVAIRHWDNVLPMLFDMAADQIEPSWVTKHIDEYFEYIESSSEEKAFAILTAKWKGMTFYKRGSSLDVYDFIPNEYSTFMSIMHRFYGKKFTDNTTIDFEKLSELIDDNFNEANTITMEESYKVRAYMFKKADISLLEEANILEYVTKEYETVWKIRRNVDKQQVTRSKFLQNLFSEK